jgi:hypothetical protein
MDSPLKIIAVCGKCLDHNSKDAALEFNFSDKCIYYICPKCKERSEMGVKPLVANPYPRAKLSR